MESKLLGGIRVRIPPGTQCCGFLALKSRDVVGFQSWNLNVIVVFCLLKKCLGIMMSWLLCLHFSMPWFFSLGISMSWLFGLGISMSWLLNKIVISKNLTFGDSDSLQAFKCELKRFLLSVELNHLRILEQLLVCNKSNSHVKVIPL